VIKTVVNEEAIGSVPKGLKEGIGCMPMETIEEATRL